MSESRKHPGKGKPAFDREMIQAAQNGWWVDIELDKNRILHCKVVYVDQYFIKVSFPPAPDQTWINKGSIVQVSISRGNHE